MSKEMSTFY